MARTVTSKKSGIVLEELVPSEDDPDLVTLEGAGPTVVGLDPMMAIGTTGSIGDELSHRISELGDVIERCARTTPASAVARV